MYTLFVLRNDIYGGSYFERVVKIRMNKCAAANT